MEKHLRVDVYVIRSSQEDKSVFDYVCTTEACDFSEMVAALEVLFPDMIGVQIDPLEVPDEG